MSKNMFIFSLALNGHNVHTQLVICYFYIALLSSTIVFKIDNKLSNTSENHFSSHKCSLVEHNS